MEYTVFFESEYTHDLKIQKEFAKGERLTNRVVNGCAVFLILILAYYFVQMILILDAPREFAGGAIAITAIWLVIEGIRLLSSLGGGVHFKRNLAANGGKPSHVKVQFRQEDALILTPENGNHTAYTYDQFRKVCETENLILCGMKYSMYLIVDKRTLSGDRQEFLDFFRSKCPKIRRIRKAKTGRILETAKWCTIVLMLLLCLVYHPAIQLKERFLGQIHSGMSTHEILAELEPFGITAEDPELLDYMYGSVYFSGTKLENLLMGLGSAEYDPETGETTPQDNGVFFTYYWSFSPETMYTDLMEGVSSLCGGEAEFGNISESVPKAGAVHISFTLNGKPHTLQAVDYYDWYDETIFNDLGVLIAEETGKQLYFADYEDSGCFLFWADEAWAQDFVVRTGMTLVTDILEIY